MISNINNNNYSLNLFEPSFTEKNLHNLFLEFRKELTKTAFAFKSQRILEKITTASDLDYYINAIADNSSMSMITSSLLLVIKNFCKFYYKNENIELKLPNIQIFRIYNNLIPTSSHEVHGLFSQILLIATHPLDYTKNLEKTNLFNHIPAQTILDYAKEIYNLIDLIQNFEQLAINDGNLLKLLMNFINNWNAFADTVELFGEIIKEAYDLDFDLVNQPQNKKVPLSNSNKEVFNMDFDLVNLPQNKMVPLSNSNKEILLKTSKATIDYLKQPLSNSIGIVLISIGSAERVDQQIPPYLINWAKQNPSKEALIILLDSAFMQQEPEFIVSSSEWLCQPFEKGDVYSPFWKKDNIQAVLYPYDYDSMPGEEEFEAASEHEKSSKREIVNTLPHLIKNALNQKAHVFMAWHANLSILEHTFISLYDQYALSKKYAPYIRLYVECGHSKVHLWHKKIFNILSIYRDSYEDKKYKFNINATDYLKWHTFNIKKDDLIKYNNDITIQDSVVYTALEEIPSPIEEPTTYLPSLAFFMHSMNMFEYNERADT